MAETERDVLNRIDTNLKTLLTTGVKVDETAILGAITAVQTTVNLILAQDQPTPTAAPALTTISPSTGSISGGETVTATGTGFEGVTGVMVGTVPATNVVVVSDTSLTYTSPAQGIGPEDVRIVSSAGTSPVVPTGVYTYA